MSHSSLFEVTLSDEKSYVIIRLNQNMNGEMQRTFAEEAINMAKVHNVNRFLADFKGVRNETDPSDHYNHGYNELTEFAMSRDSRIAILVDPRDSSFNILVTVMCNAGYNFKRFTNKQQALSWLLK